MPDIVRFRKANLLSILVNLKKIKFLIECIAFKANTVRIIKYTFIDEDSIEFNRYPKSFLIFLCSEGNSFKSTCFFLCQQKSIPIITLFFNALLQNKSVLYTRNYCLNTYSELECFKVKKKSLPLKNDPCIVLSLPYFDRSAVSDMHISLLNFNPIEIISTDRTTHL